MTRKLKLADELAAWLEKPALDVGASEAANRLRTAEYLLGFSPAARTSRPDIHN